MSDSLAGESGYSEAFTIGVAEGIESPFDLSVGMTWGDERDEDYDFGVNVGQNLTRLLMGAV